MDNAAFHDGYELQRIVKEVSKKLDYCANEGFIRDINGNLVGKWKIK